MDLPLLHDELDLPLHHDELDLPLLHDELNIPLIDLSSLENLTDLKIGFSSTISLNGVSLLSSSVRGLSNLSSLFIAQK
jgi:hypothetical protein